jgi:hypothetical protein
MPPAVVRLLGAGAFALTSLACASCWYDSTWGQAKAAQKRYAAAATPSAIVPTDDARPGAPKRTYRIRLRPDAHYLSQTVDAERQLEALVDDADRVLGASLGLHLEVQKTEAWSLDNDESLEAALAALRHDDAGEDVDVVVGLIGALPRPTDSFHEVGYAEVLGKHLVVRAASRLGEHDAVDRALTELSADERDRLVASRRRHRAEAVFLHELGHVLGALHEADAASLMHPAYDEKMTSFGDDAVVLMRLALDEGDRAAVVHAQLDYVRNAKTTSWATGEREAALKRLQAMDSPPPTSAASAARIGGVGGSGGSGGGDGDEVDVPFELTAPDRERFAQAMKMFRAGAAAPAYQVAKPLFAAYPSTYAVQDLRCQLATVRWLEKDAMMAECAPSVRLADAGADASR